MDLQGLGVAAKMRRLGRARCLPTWSVQLNLLNLELLNRSKVQAVQIVRLKA